MDKSLIASASKKLRLLDVYLNESKLDRNNDLGVLIVPARFSQQSRLAIKAEEIIIGNDDGEEKVLRVFVTLGARATDDGECDNSSDTDKSADSVAEEKTVLFSIEAVFAVDYLMLDDVADDEVEEFCQYNAVHNVWPFWRAHVFNTLKAGNLPMLSIPLQRLDQCQNPDQ